MAAESARRFEALEGQADRIMTVFTRAGYERVAPAIIQPAGIFLDRVGEAIRTRTYVFTDYDGSELCLRPELTIPVCRIYMERHPQALAPHRFCYNGPAFRAQPGEPDDVHPREFRQAGIECFGAADAEEAEAEVLSLVTGAIRAAGVSNFALRLGDLGLFHALLEALPMPGRWRERLRRSFWRPQAFHEALHRLSETGAANGPSPADALIGRLDAKDTPGAEAQVLEYLEQSRMPLIAARGLGEITARLLDEAADRREKPLSKDIVRLIESYLAFSGPASTAHVLIEDLMRGAHVDIKTPLDIYRRRLDLIGKTGADTAKAVFSADFGREFEYYTGFVFQLEIPGKGMAGQIAGGGRYDGLLRSIGAPRDVPAFGSAIDTERLLAAAQGDGA